MEMNCTSNVVINDDDVSISLASPPVDHLGERSMVSMDTCLVSSIVRVHL